MRRTAQLARRMLVLGAALCAPVSADALLAARIDQASRALLGARYRVGPLGEGVSPDADPRFRLDEFDCTTYVETVLALALTGRQPADALAAADVLPVLDRIRYAHGVASFTARRHLIDSQWIPQLAAEELLRDVTAEVGGPSTRRLRVRLDRRRWERSTLHRDGLPFAAVPAGAHSLRYLPWSALERSAVLDALPVPAVVSVVARPPADAPTLVSHQGLLFRGAGGELVLRHASARHRRVVEEPFSTFVESARSRRSREQLGVHLLAVAPSRDWIE